MIEPRHGSGVMRAGHFLVVGAAAVVAIIIAFTVFSFVAGVIFEIVKIAVIAAIVLGAFWAVSRYARRGRPRP